MNKEKLLHVSLGTHNTEMWASFDRHFETLHYDWTVKQNGIHSLNADLLYHCDTFKPDVVFMQIQGGEIIQPEVLKKISELSITVLFNGDVRIPIPRWELDLGKLVDLTIHTNMHYVNELQKLGVNARYLNVGFDENIFTPIGTNGGYPKIIFLGSNYSHTSNFPLSGLRESMVRQLKQQHGSNFEAFGSNWRGVSGDERFLGLHEEAQAYRTCEIAINLSHFDYGRYSSDRLLRLMGSGAFCLSHHYKNIEQDFKIGKHLDSWHTLPELTSKIDYYLNNEVKRIKISKAGCSIVRDNFTWNNFVIELKKMIGY